MSLNHFDEYVRGTGRFLEVFTDHNPLVFLHRMKNANQRLMRWCLLLQDYDLVIKHVGGEIMSFSHRADVLNCGYCVMDL